jgi:hypothetical protein
MLSHVAVGRLIQHVIGVARARQVEEFSRLFDDRVPNQVNQSLPICVQKPFLPAWRAPVSSTDTYADVSSPARRTSWATETPCVNVSGIWRVADG